MIATNGYIDMTGLAKVLLSVTIDATGLALTMRLTPVL